MLDQVFHDLENAPVSAKMKALLHIAVKVQRLGKEVKETDIACAKTAGATDREIHDTVLIAALFSLYNRYVDGLGTYHPEDPAYYQRLAARLVTIGYARPKDGIVRTGEESYK